MEAKISVIIPNYNHAVYLRQRIDSVLNQTCKDFELILLDDCSTDGSRDILEEYRNHPAVSHLVLNTVNTGSPFHQWKKGVELARGEWIWIAESDDYADKTFLEKMMTAARRYPQAGLVYCDSRIIDAKDMVTTETFAVLKNRRFRTDRWSHAHLNDGVNEIERYLLPGGTINNTSAVLFKRSVVSEADLFDTEFRYIGDKYAFIKVLALADVAYVPEALNYYRDPFNSKHAGKFLFYAYEQFLVFDWVYRNIRITDRKEFFQGFYTNTRNSLFKEWSSIKFSLYRKMLSRNPYLFLKSMRHNLTEGVFSRAGIAKKLNPARS
jgi:glycosyltransferase involved in cell wall biosynthesis